LWGVHQGGAGRFRGSGCFWPKTRGQNLRGGGKHGEIIENGRLQGVNAGKNWKRLERSFGLARKLAGELGEKLSVERGSPPLFSWSTALDVRCPREGEHTRPLRGHTRLQPWREKERKKSHQAGGGVEGQKAFPRIRQAGLFVGESGPLLRSQRIAQGQGKEGNTTIN